MHVVDEVRNDVMDVDNTFDVDTENLVTNGETSHKSMGVENDLRRTKEKVRRLSQY